MRVLDLPITEGANSERDLSAKLRRNGVQGLLEKRFHRSRGLPDGYAGLEPRKRAQNDLPGMGPAIARSVQSGWNKDVVVAEARHFKLSRENSGNRRGLPIE